MLILSSQPRCRRKLNRTVVKQDIWPNGDLVGFIQNIGWLKGVGGTNTLINMPKAVPPTTNLICTWDAAGISSTSTIPNMLYAGMTYCDWGHYIMDNNSGYNHKHDVVTKVDLFTGGFPLVSRTNLHVMLVGAWTRTGDNPPNFQTGVMMPFEDYTIRGQHPDANGYVWLILPDNDYFDVTPAANTNYTNYVFGYTPYKVRLGIFRDGIEITNDTPEIWVGEEAKMDCRLVGAPANFPLSNFVWTIPGLTISNYYADSQTGRVDAAFSKTNNEVKYYWVAVDGGEAEVKVQAVVNGITLHAGAGFRVRRPNASVAAAIHSPVTVDNNFQFQPALHFGNKNAIVGIRFTYTTDYVSPPNYDWVQVGMFASRYQDATNGVWYRAGTNGLDTRFTYGQETLSTAADSPGIQLQSWYQACSHGNAFTMYLIFQPPVNRPKIWVPLRSVVWGWSGQATVSGGNWTLVPNSGSSTAGQDADATAHPTWERNITNYHQLFVPE